MIIISGTTVTPSSFSMSLQDIVESIPNANGTLISDKIATKRVLELSWSYLTNAQMSQIMTLFTSSFYVSVTYPDIVTGADRTSTFRPSERKGGTFKYSGGVVTGWVGVSFGLLEV